MSKGSILIYTSAAGQAAPLAGAALTVLDESGTALAHLTADADGRAEAADLPAPDAAYSLDAANTAVRPYALYRIEAALDGWQPLVLDGVQVFDGQQTVARLALLPRGTVPAAARSSEAEVIAIPPHTLFSGNSGSGPCAGGDSARRCTEPGRYPQKDHRASGQAHSEHRQCDGELSVLHCECRIQ